MSFLVHIRYDIRIEHPPLPYTDVTLASLTHLPGTLQYGPLLIRETGLPPTIYVVPDARETLGVVVVLLLRSAATWFNFSVFLFLGGHCLVDDLTGVDEGREYLGGLP
jgi:hypothetical protein